MAQDVRQLLLQVDASVELARRNLNQLAAEVQRDSARMDNSLAQVEGPTPRLGAGFGRLQSMLAGFGIAVGIGTVTALGRSILEMGDDIEAAADRAGMGVERFQTLRQALRTLEVDAATVDRTFSTLQETMGAVQNGTDNTATQALDRLGIKARILNGEIDSTDELLDALAAASRNAGREAQSLADLSETVGRRIAARLAPALRDGCDAYREIEEAARSTGSYLSEEQVRELAQANEAIARFAEQTQYKFATWAATVISFFQNLNEAVDSYRDRISAAIGVDVRGLLLGYRSFRDIGTSLVQGENESRQRESGAPPAATPRPWWQTAREGAAARGRRPPAGRDPNGEIGREAPTADVDAVLRELGARVTSGNRTRAQQQRLYDQWARGGRRGQAPALPGTSLHETGIARDIAPGISLGTIRSAFSRRGITLAELLNEGDHIHIGVRRSGRGSGRGGSMAVREQQEARREAERRAREADEQRRLWETRRFESQPSAPPSFVDEADLVDLDTALASIEEIHSALASLDPLPDLGELLSTEDQQRLASFRDDVLRDIAGEFAHLVTNIEDVGDALDALIGIMSRVAQGALETGIYDLLSGRPWGDSFFAQLPGLFGGGRRGGGGGGSAAGAGFGALAGLAFGGRREHGGPVAPGMAYLVGEKRPELFVPSVPGTIVPNVNGGGGGGGRALVQLALTSDLDARIVQVSGPVAVEIVGRAAPRSQSGVVDALTRPELA